MGQNFLKSASALSAMCEAGHIDKDDTVLEIGPGKGALTERLLTKAGKVIAIEKDRDLIVILEEKFKKEIATGNLVLVHGDVLEFDPSLYGLKAGEYKISANIPYNITGAIFKRFLEEVPSPECMTLLVQKEVAERVIARPAQGGARDRKESILSLSVKAYGEPKYIMKVGKRFFSPAPKVDSAIIHIANISKKALKNKAEEARFFEVIHAGFSHKRKYARRNLESAGLASEQLDIIFEKLGINPQARAEDLPLPVWIAIANYKF
jgi:16S rRNA (adenine1518-N6/adenine1519-N6)-dimethyltransferase